jgi:hypothetical protein
VGASSWHGPGPCHARACKINDRIRRATCLSVFPSSSLNLVSISALTCSNSTQCRRTHRPSPHPRRSLRPRQHEPKSDSLRKTKTKASARLAAPQKALIRRLHARSHLPRPRRTWCLLPEARLQLVLHLPAGRVRLVRRQELWVRLVCLMH